MELISDFVFNCLKWWHCAGIGIVIIIIMKRITKRLHTTNYAAKGKTILITGANCGIGKAAATEFAKRDARVILACRDINKAKDAVFDIRRKTTKGILIIKHLDLASLSSVRKFAQDVLSSEEKLDVLINNAGVMRIPYALTENGFEIAFGVNHLGHYLLTNLLLDLLKKSQPSRVVVVSSMLYTSGTLNFDDLNGQENFSSSKAYSQSKLANILFSNSLSKKLKGTGVTVNSLSPGMVKTNLGRHYIGKSWIKRALYETIGRLVFRSAGKGSETVVYCALNPDLLNVTGKFFRDCKEKKLLPLAKDDHVAKKLWEVSEKLTASPCSD